MSFRPATFADEQLFLDWRRRDEAKGAAEGWWKGPKTTAAEHHDWFVSRFGRATLLVWQDGSGIARIDSNDELAFSTADQRMLEAVKAITCGRLKATVDLGDPKAEALEAAGFVESPVRFYTYRP